jgi:hypothetical protein
MSIIPRCILVSACVFAVFSTPVTAQAKPAGAGAPPAAQGEKDKKAPTFAVVQVGDELKVMAESGIEKLKKDEQASFDKANADFAKAKKDAEAAGKKFDGKAPKMKTVEVKKGGFPTEAAANAYKTDLQKPKEKPKEAPKDAKGSKKGH